MFASYLKVALRNALGQKLYALINIAGLGVGIACFMLIVLFVRNEFSYDRSFAGAERLYRVAQQISPGDGSPDIVMATNSPQVAELLKQDYADVARAARLRSWNTAVGRSETERAYEQVGLADNELLRLFDFIWIAGDPANALEGPAAAVLTVSMARKYFGTDEPMGQTLVIGNGLVVTVTGIIEDLPSTTHLRFNLLASMPLATSAFALNALENWSAQDYYTYVELVEGADIQEFTAQLPSFIERYVGEGASEVFSFNVLPVTDIHLHSATRNEMSPPGSSAMVYAFIAIAVVILLIACINFMNLATARSNRRAREIGVRKAVGATRWQLIGQFLGESALLTIIAMLVAITLVEIALPLFNVLVGKELTTTYSASLWTWPFIIALTTLVSLLAGSWPAFHLSAFRPVSVLRGNSDGSARTAPWFRSTLVVLQFSIAVVLLISTLTINAQIDFARTFDPGYDTEQVVVLETSGSDGLGAQWDQLKRELLQQPGVMSVTASNSVPGSAVGPSYFLRSEGSGEQRSMPVMLVDFDFFETYGIKLVAGRSFSPAYGTDQRTISGADNETSGGTYVINELSARQLGWTPDEAIGKWLEVTCCGFGRGLVVGVVQDVYLESLQQAVAPLIYLIPPEPRQTINSETRLGLRQASLKISTQDIPGTLAAIDSAWSRVRPDQPVSRRFLVDDFAALYRNEESQATMLGTFAGLAILITCLGLYGLSAFNTEARRKEIGVRKVMGGSVWGIVLLLTNDFSKLVLLSNLIAWPVAYIAMARWLENFAYRIDLAPLIFLGSGLIALCIAWVTVGGTAAKAASAKPVLALRYE